MVLEDAIRQAEQSERERAERAAQQAAEDEKILSSIQSDIDRLAGEALEWLRSNPKPMTGYGTVTVRLAPDLNGSSRDDRYELTIHRRGWRLGSYVLDEDGHLYLFNGNAGWQPELYLPDKEKDRFLAAERERLGLSALIAFGGLEQLRPIVREQSTEWTNPAEILRRENGELYVSGLHQTLADVIARGLLDL